VPRLAFWGEAVGHTESFVRFAFLSLLAIQAQAGTAIAQECPIVGQLYSIDGQVEVQHQGAWRPASLNQSLCAHDAVRTSSLSRAAVMLVNEAVLRIDQDTTVYLTNVTTDTQKRTLLDLARGAFQSFSRQPHSIQVNTPYLNAAVGGTEFVIRTSAGRTDVTTFEGVVTATNRSGSVTVPSGHSVSATAGQAPRPYIMVRPRDAVQWGLYYPPILAISGAKLTGVRPEFAASLKRAAQHDVAGAFAALAAVPSGERDAGFYIFEAALLLSVGRVDEARKIIDQVIAHGAHAGLAFALRAVIEVVQNEKEAALADAKRGVELEPDAAAPRIALSYAQQANFDLKGARDTLLEATARQPENALAWARLGELWLMFGYRNRAREAAEKGVQLAPDLERVHLVFGFTALTEFRTKIAREEFGRAIELDSADPLARFGLGLAIIRDGALAEGRRYLEMAVGLDSSNSLLRSYLGKAYFEEKRDPLDAKQFDIAKQLDPLDPTPYLYDAIRLQSINRPVEAMLNMEKSIELNDNRAIYRSRELLDSDRATRGADLAQIYQDLGFDQLALDQGYESLGFDPGNTSAHRFLADAYIGVPRLEIARVSQLLQSQMLQDININPVQPSLAETNLSLVTRGGPFKPGYNEYTPLFERNDLQILGSGLWGNEDTFSGEGIASALYDRFSISAGIFGYETEGWRPNNNIQHDIENFFMQAAVTPDLNVQVELRRRESEQGDLAFNFDPNLFNPDFQRSIDHDTARVGARYSPSPNSSFLASFIFSDLLEQQDFPSVNFRGTAEDKGSQLESQYIYTGDWLNLIVGLGHTDVNRTLEATGQGQALQGLQHEHPYVYTNIKFPSPVIWTLGVSYDDFQNDPVEVKSINPKFGVRWDITSNLSIRAAAFKWVKPPLIADRTLEPTEVSGFNQFFDNSNGDEAWRRGVGLDWRLTKQLFAGAEATWRDITVPITESLTKATSEDWKEQLHLAYLFWAPTRRISLSGQVVYDTFESEKGLLTSFSSTPESLKTFSIPLGVRYFDPSGFFAGVFWTHVNQEVVRSPIALQRGFSDGRSDFFVVDASVGWRFPKRLGIATLTVKNLLNQKFLYQDDSFREFRDEPSTSPFIPERQVVGRATLYF
jgi:ferric-dicitrate binding protein FerR (iron transport regulator)